MGSLLGLFGGSSSASASASGSLLGGLLGGSVSASGSASRSAGGGSRASSQSSAGYYEPEYAYPPSLSRSNADTYSLSDGVGNIYNINLGSGNQAIAINQGDADYPPPARSSRGPRAESEAEPNRTSARSSSSAGRGKGEAQSGASAGKGSYSGGLLSGFMDVPIVGSALELCGGILGGIGLGSVGKALYGSRTDGKDSY